MKVRLATVSAFVILGTALPGHTGQLEDDLYRINEARAAAPGAYQQAAADDLAYWTWYSTDYAPSRIGHAACAPPTGTFVHQSPKDLSPVALIPAKDVIEVHGNCSSPHFTSVGTYVQLGWEVRRFVANTWIRSYGGMSEVFPMVAGQGAAATANVFTYAWTSPPSGFLRLCAWYEQPHSTASNPTCSVPNPVV